MTRLILVDSEKFGLSPVERNFTINWAGKFSSAILDVEFQESFGYGLTEVYLNGARFVPQSSSHFSKDVKDLLKQGDNKITIVFNALQVFGQPLGAAQITAYIDYFGASVLKTPSLNQFVKDVENTLSKSTGKVILIIAGFAVAAASLAYIASRLPSAGNVKLGDVSHSTKNTFEKSASHVKHAIMTIKEKV